MREVFCPDNTAQREGPFSVGENPLAQQCLDAGAWIKDAQEAPTHLQTCRDFEYRCYQNSRALPGSLGSRDKSTVKYTKKGCEYRISISTGIFLVCFQFVYVYRYSMSGTPALDCTVHSATVSSAGCWVLGTSASAGASLDYQ